MVLARIMYKVIPEELKEPLRQGRLLIISTSNDSRQSKATAFARNKYVCEISDNIVFVGANEKSSLYELSSDFQSKITDI